MSSLERRENVVFLGPPGVGKTHLAISLAIAAAQSGRRVYYGTLADLITSLEEAQAAGRLQARLKVLTHLALLVEPRTLNSLMNAFTSAFHKLDPIPMYRATTSAGEYFSAFN